MLSSLDALRRAPDATLVHCAHEYTLSNIRFARAAEPGNAALAQWQKEAESLRARNQPTIPTTLLHERNANPFLRVGEKKRTGNARCAVRAPRARPLDAFTLMRGWKDKISLTRRGLRLSSSETLKTIAGPDFAEFFAFILT